METTLLPDMEFLDEIPETPDDGSGILMLLAIVLLLVAVFGPAVYHHFNDRKKPVHRERAKVLNQYHYRKYWGENKLGIQVLPFSWKYIQFMLEDGKVIALNVNGDTYYSLKEGDEGILEYQGYHYKGFDKQ